MCLLSFSLSDPAFHPQVSSRDSLLRSPAVDAEQPRNSVLKYFCILMSDSSEGRREADVKKLNGRMKIIGKVINISYSRSLTKIDYFPSFFKLPMPGLILFFRSKIFFFEFWYLWESQFKLRAREGDGFVAAKSNQTLWDACRSILSILSLNQSSPVAKIKRETFSSENRPKIEIKAPETEFSHFVSKIRLRNDSIPCRIALEREDSKSSQSYSHFSKTFVLLVLKGERQGS